MNLSFTVEQRALAEEARAWVAENYTPPPSFATLDEEIEWGREWQRTLAQARWVGIDWPSEYGGRGASPFEVVMVNAEFARARVPQPVNRVGLTHAGPTVLAYGTEEQKQRWLPRILDASEIWCQLFSEPGAGSDLSSLATRSVRVDGGWVLTGQKVWSSYAQHARWSLCLARTDPSARGHRGISYFALDMKASGVNVRPLRQITGDYEFNEVFLDDAFVPDDAVLGDVNGGWEVAGTTLAYERGINLPVKEQVVHEVLYSRIFEAADRQELLDDPVVADALASAYVQLRLLSTTNLRTLARVAAGEKPGPESSVAKMLWSSMTQHMSQVWFDIEPFDAAATRQFLWSKAASIAGGTSEIQRTIVAERLLGLPRS